MNIEKTNLDRGNCFIIEEKKYLEICSGYQSRDILSMFSNGHEIKNLTFKANVKKMCVHAAYKEL